MQPWELLLCDATELCTSLSKCGLMLLVERKVNKRVVRIVFDKEGKSSMQRPVFSTLFCLEKSDWGERGEKKRRPRMENYKEALDIDRIRKIA